MNLAQLLLRAARTFPERPAVTRGTSVITGYAGLASRASQIAHAFRHRLGLQAGDRVALCMTNCTQYLELVFAAWWAGLVIVPINAKLHAKEVRYILENARARLCFLSADLAHGMQSLEGIRSMPRSHPAARYRCSPASPMTSHGCFTPAGPRGFPRA
jgi:long-chain acyl-CoA synthetase